MAKKRKVYAKKQEPVAEVVEAKTETLEPIIETVTVTDVQKTQAEPETRICKSCGNKIPKTMITCHICGNE